MIMATTAKKPPAPPVEEAQVAAPVAEPVPVAPELEPMKAPEPEAMIGYTPLNDDQIRRVNMIKTQFDDSVRYLLTLRDAYHASETQRALDVAIAHAETASMWAVRAITKAI